MILIPIAMRTSNLLLARNSIFVSLDKTSKVKVITKFIYLNINHDIFRPLLGHHQVYLYIFNCVLASQEGICSLELGR
jgi:hypothetical protein